MDVITYSEARDKLKSVLDKVVADRAPTLIYRQRGESVVLLAQSDYDGMVETLHLMSNPRNAARLLAAARRMDKGKGQERELVDP